MRELPGTVSFDDQSLKGFTARIIMLSQVVGKFDSYLHIRITRLLDEILNPSVFDFFEQLTER